MLVSSLPRSSTAPLLVALAALNGVAVSTLYWAQALVGVAGQEFVASPWMSLMPSATLAGYALGVALLACLAKDMAGANGLGSHVLLLAVSLFAAATASEPAVLVLACLMIGVGCALTQRVLACATSAVLPERRGPVIGWVVASGLTGIVLARAAVPYASAAFGWRTVFGGGAAAVCGIGLLAALAAQRTGGDSWRFGAEPLPSPQRLWCRLPALRRAACQQACVFAVFNLGWTVFPRTLAHHGAATGALPMGVVAALGAAAALGAGWLCRSRPPGDIASIGLSAVLLAGAGLLLAPASGPAAYVAMTMLDVGTQTSLVANQAQAQAEATSAAMRGRLAAIVTTVGFIGGAVGAALGSL